MIILKGRTDQPKNSLVEYAINPSKYNILKNSPNRVCSLLPKSASIESKSKFQRKVKNAKEYILIYFACLLCTMSKRKRILSNKSS